MTLLFGCIFYLYTILVHSQDDLIRSRTCICDYVSNKQTNVVLDRYFLVSSYIMQRAESHQFSEVEICRNFSALRTEYRGTDSSETSGGAQ